MDLIVGAFWLAAFTVIVLFLGVLNYFIGRSHLTVNPSEKSQVDTANPQQQQTGRTQTSSSRRKHARNAQKKLRQQALATTANDDSNSNKDEDTSEQQACQAEMNIDEDEQADASVVQASVDQSQHEEGDEYEDSISFDEAAPLPSSASRPSVAPIQEEDEEPMLPMKQRNKHRTHTNNSKSNGYSTHHAPSSSSTNNAAMSAREDLSLPSKPQASVAPVKQAHSSFAQEQADRVHYSSSNGTSSSYKVYPYGSQNSVPPRFRYKQDPAPSAPKFQKRKFPAQPTHASIPDESAARQNDFAPSPPQQRTTNEHQFESSTANGYSSESDIVSESAPASSLESHSSVRGLDFLRSLSSSHVLLNELISVFDTTPFSSDELELILNKIATKHVLTKQDRQQLFSTSKSDKIIERILDETNRSQVKILAIELQTEKQRVLELTKTNAELDQAVRLLQQQQQQQQQPHNLVQYQQTIVSYQMRMQRLTDENARLSHQLHAYSMMPGTINELKQQQQILNEQMRQLNIRNSALEKEIGDGERASKQAAEIYKKADAQKQERIEQMIADINKYRKMDKEITALRQKCTETEKTLSSKVRDLTKQRDDLQESVNQSKEKVQEYEQLKAQQNQVTPSTKDNESSKVEQFQKEIKALKAKNDLLRQRNWKIMEQLNKFSHERPSDPADQSSSIE